MRIRNKPWLAVLGLLALPAIFSVAQVGPGPEGGGNTPQGSTFATQYKVSPTAFGGTGPGTTGQVLTSRGASLSPTFQTINVSPGGSNFQLQYNNAGAFGGFSNGSAGQLLMSGGAGAAPSFVSTITGSKAFTGVVTFQNGIDSIGYTVQRQQSPSALSTTNNNYDFGGVGCCIAPVYRLTPAGGGSTITGMTKTATDFFRVTLINVSATDSITFTNEGGGSTAGNRILTPNGASFVLQPQAAAEFWYDNTGSARWRVIDVVGGSTGFPLLAPDGSAGAPSYSFTNSSTSGLYWDNGDNDIVLRSAGDVRLFANSGSYLIGTGAGAPLLGSATAYVTNGGTCSISGGSGISSASHPATGTCDLLFSATFGSAPICTASQSGAAPTAIVAIGTVTTGGVTVNSADYLTGLATDADFNIICQGT